MSTKKVLLLSMVAVTALMVTQAPLFAQGVITGPEITAFPDGDADSGRFVNITNGLSTLGEAGTNLCIETPTTSSEFLLQIFDGDYGDLWDLGRGTSPVVLYRLYADPGATGAQTTLVEEWTSTQMVNDDWFTCTSDNSSTANPTSSGARVVNVIAAQDTTDALPLYRYNLVVTWQQSQTRDALNSFKVRVEGEVFGLRLSRYGFSAFKWGAGGYGYEHPDDSTKNVPWDYDGVTGLFSNLQPATTTYDGKWLFRLEIPAQTDFIDLWNGDFDLEVDTDDPNTGGIPSWALAGTEVAEGGGLGGSPSDDDVRRAFDPDTQTYFYIQHPYVLTSPYSGFDVNTGIQSGPGLIQLLSDEDRDWTVEDLNPSGDQEWEVFRVAAQGSSSGPDVSVTGLSSLPAGRYWWEFEGVDVQNTLFLRSNYNLRTVPGALSLGDRVWLDLDDSGGTDDLTEPGINGVVVNLYQRINNSWVFYAAALTGPIGSIDGYYFFENLAPGEYRIEVETATLPAGVGPSYDLDGTGTPNVVELTGVDALDADNLAVDFSYADRGSIGDFVWFDIDNDGVQDVGEPGIAGVTVELWADLNNTGTFALLDTDVTDANGGYLFGGLVAGDYEVRIDTSTLPVALRAPTWDYDDQNTFPNIVSAHVAQLTLGQTETNLAVDFGYTEGGGPQEVKGSIGDFVWRDSNGDGVQDLGLGELPIAGVTVVLRGDVDGDGDIDILRTTTNSAGFYLFTNLSMGRYLVTIAAGNFNTGGPLNGYRQTYDFDLTLDNRTVVRLIERIRENFRRADFGYRPKCPPGTGTPGYWKNHKSAWPVRGIRIGGNFYTVDDAIRLMGMSEKGDKTFTAFRHLVAAKLNVGVGNDFSCVADDIRAVNAWLRAHPVGSMVRSSSPAWQRIQRSVYRLDQYNNGKLPCAESRDNVTCSVPSSSGSYQQVTPQKSAKSSKPGNSGQGGGGGNRAPAADDEDDDGDDDDGNAVGGNPGKGKRLGRD